MTRAWLILADDLTGAADCAIAFARRGVASAVGWGDLNGRAADEPPVFSYDAASRGLPAAAAAERHRALLGGLLRPGMALFKKIDSTLRGQPAAETRAAIEAVRARGGAALGILAPAFPAAGRTTVAGRVLVDGAPLEDTEVWQREHTYPSADLVAVMASAGIRARNVPLEIVRSDEARLRAAIDELAGGGDGVAVCDAVNEGDLEAIARATLSPCRTKPANDALFWIGSAGLAHALANTLPTAMAEPIRLSGHGGGTLIVVGSLAGASRQAARRLAAEHGVVHVRVEPDLLLGDDQTAQDAILDSVLRGLQARADVLVEIVMGPHPDLAAGPRIAERLGALLEPAAAHMGGLAATGGETAAALLEHFGVNGLRLVDEIEPGVSLGLTMGRHTVPIVTKAGAFGNPDTLVHAAHRLRGIMEKGFVG